MKNLVLATLLLTPGLHANAQDLTTLSKELEALKKIVSIQQSQLNAKFSSPDQRLCTGSTVPGQNWTAYGTKGITITIDTSSCNFSETPKYFTNLTGNSSHWMTSGVTSIYNASAKGFTVYIYFHYDNTDFLSFAKSTNYRIEWLAAGK